MVLRNWSRLAVLIPMICLWAGHAWAAQYFLTPSLKLRETYDDNLFLEEISDLEHLISPAVGLKAKTERSEMEARGAWDISKFQRHDELDTTDQSYSFSATVGATSLTELTFSGTHMDDYTFVSALEESGIVAERSRRRRSTLQPGVTFTVDPRNTVSLSYEFTNTQYELDAYADYEVNGLSLTWHHALANERTRLIGSVRGDQVDFQGRSSDLEQKTYRALAGVEHEWTERVKGFIMAGARYTESEYPKSVLVEVAPGVFAVRTTTEEDDEAGFILDGSLDWRSELVTLSAGINRDVTSSLYGELMTRDRVTADASFRLSEYFRFGLGTAYYQSETEGLVQPEERKTFVVRPSLGYRFTEDIGLRLGYAYSWTENEITDRAQERNRVYLELTTAWPLEFEY